MSNIEQYKLSKSDQTNILLFPIEEVEKSIPALSVPHRDDHYLLLIALEGEYHLKIDFVDVLMSAPFVLSIEPNQVHQIISFTVAKGWALGIEEFVLEEEFLTFLETKLKKPLILNNAGGNINSLLAVANSIQQSGHTIYTQKAVQFLINSFFCLLFEEANSEVVLRESKEKRSQMIEHTFRQLLKKHFIEWKSPSQYASALSISTSHLNDSIKETTGFPVSYHIQHRNITEAKRLLHFTDLEIQELAFRLGYSDNVYFGKLFKKLCGTSPLAFRKQFRD